MISISSFVCLNFLSSLNTTRVVYIPARHNFCRKLSGQILTLVFHNHNPFGNGLWILRTIFSSVLEPANKKKTRFCVALLCSTMQQGLPLQQLVVFSSFSQERQAT